ncbi:MAG: type II toxin-antitoxin system VapC family toxin [Marmoricola sp.]
MQGEPEGDSFAELMLSERCRMSVANWLESAMVVDGRSRTHQEEFAELLHLADVELVDVTTRQVMLARAAHRRYGKGSGSSAGLNYGDCFAYALATETGEPLLYKGDDFGHTDIRSATSG